MLNFINNSSQRPSVYFAAPAAMLIAVELSFSSSLIKRVLVPLLITEMGRRLLVVSSLNANREESLSKKVSRFLGQASGIAIIIAGLCVGYEECVMGPRERNNREEFSRRNESELTRPREASTRETLIPTIFDEESFWKKHVPIGSIGRDGPCDGEGVLEVLQNSPHLPSGIHFNRESLSPYLRFGNCSASTLGFVKEAIVQCSHESEQSPELCLSSVMKGFQYPSKEIRDHQSAFNTIIVDKIGEDPVRDKIQALANLHDLEISRAIPQESFLMEKIRPTLVMEELSSVVNRDSLSSGLDCYVVRGINHNPNARKLENFGHTTAIFVSDEVIGYYDPARDGGLYMGPRNDARWSSAIAEGLERDASTYEFSSYRIFQVEPRDLNSVALKDEAKISPRNNSFSLLPFDLRKSC